ncbi:hypothetical protein PF005_g11234 [Phytophthora fragariae]|uniref:Uncharacterized protein n=1 Tax=Phytophthora fragariae TaxID=53985 RepID=A0A6A3TW27_9STRA|nr:hypothetical protein PF003_g14073 [Phytophthora fragariae]KAE8932869.1 hypothetical protein PF009_g17124 [Phytophthora fragariae]KAE8999135.1 hypothetical protein PF011_g14747 [Phytophthora fragariae]KAE9071881.1 hypothetical protein PF010_g25698 [Phytophthora fragariae]KAE9087322.1 hypothetical protein PF007_g20420 [Phytophthora fragariae]
MNFFDEAEASTSLLMQCGYRSKVCTTPRATKLDGTLHKLCEFHRRKANLNQQRCTSVSARNEPLSSYASRSRRTSSMLKITRPRKPA